jgi:hypothetical protein
MDSKRMDEQDAPEDVEDLDLDDMEAGEVAGGAPLKKINDTASSMVQNQK